MTRAASTPDSRGLLRPVPADRCVPAVAAAPSPAPLPAPPGERVALLRQPTLTPRAIAAPTRARRCSRAERPLSRQSRLLPSPARTDPVCGHGALRPHSVAYARQSACIAHPRTPDLAADKTIIGYSCGAGLPDHGAALRLRRARILLLVGGIHGGWEANTVRLKAGPTDRLFRSSIPRRCCRACLW